MFSEATKRLRDAGLVAAREYVLSLAELDDRDEIFGRLAASLVSKNDPRASSLIAEIRGATNRAFALLFMGLEYVERQMPTQAREALQLAASTAEESPDGGYDVPSIMLQACAGLYKLGFKSEGISLLRRTVPLAKTGDDFGFAEVLAGCALKLAKWGFQDEAYSVVEQIPREQLRSYTLKKIQKL
jgi:hypothetical protein